MKFITVKGKLYFRTCLCVDQKTIRVLPNSFDDHSFGYWLLKEAKTKAKAQWNGAIFYQIICFYAIDE